MTPGRGAWLMLLVAGAWLDVAPAAAQESVATRELEASRVELDAPVWSVPVLHSTTLMLAMRSTEAVIWPEPFAFTGAQISAWPMRYERAFTEPPKLDLDRPWFEWDGDPWPINVVGHALFGSELFLRMRTCRHRVPLALAFTAGASALWEYGFEANGVQPSGLDLVWTPVAGLLLGELRYAGWLLAGEASSPGLRRGLRVLLDPLGELERALGTPC